MADGKFSLDDILNEYSSDSRPSRTETSSISLDDILADFSSNDSSRLIAEADRQTAAKQQADYEEKKRRQVDYEILSGDYERKYLPEELKTPDEIDAKKADEKREQALSGIFDEIAAEKEKQNDAPKFIPAPDAPIEWKLDEPAFTIEEPAKAAPAEKAEPSPAPAAEIKAAPEPKETPELSAQKSKKVKIRPVKQQGFSDSLDKLSFKGVHNDDDDDEFERKYGSSPLFVTGETTGSAELPFEPDVPVGRSFSEKMEMDELYNDRRNDENEHRSKKVTVTPASHSKKPAQSVPVQKPAQKDPFAKYSSLDDVDSILDEYDRRGVPSNPMKRSETSPLKGFTDIFNKLMAKEEETDDFSQTGNSELLESIKNLRRTAPAGPAPIERKTISDIDLDLADKMIQDTTPIKVNKEAELKKFSELKERRNAKIKDFVLVGEEEETPPEELPKQEKELDDFESLIDAPSIEAHIASQHSKLLFRLIILLICLAATTYIAVANDYELPIINSFGLINKRTQPDVFMFINSVIGVMAGFFSYQTVANGMSKLVSLKADTDSLSALALISALATSMVTLADSNMVRGSFVYIYIPVAIGALMFNTIGKLLIISRTKRSFRFISGDNDRYALFIVDDEEKAQDFTRGSLMDFPILASMQKTEMVTDFLKTSYAADSADRFCKIVAPIITGAALLIGVIAGLLGRPEHGTMGAVCMGLSAFSCCICMCCCFAMMIVVNLPMNKASKKYNENQGAILGFDSIDEFSDVNSIMIDASQLFPAGSVTLKNIKSFPDTGIDEAILQAASLTSQSGSILKHMFYDIIVGKTEMLNHVESYIYEDSLGLCGWINNKRVLLGNRELMANHSIEGLPSVLKEKEYTEGDKTAVYLSISGQLSAMFIIEIGASYQISQALKELEKAHINVMVRSVDSIISVNKLSEMFGVSPSTFRLIPFRIHPQYEQTTSYVAKRPATLACTGKFAAFANLILGSNRLRGTISGGLIMQAAAILAGILLTLTMVLMNALPELSVTKVLIYNAFFTLLYYAYQSLRKI